MSISEEEFRKIASLARLEFDPGEARTIQKSLESFVGYLDKLKNLNTESIEPMMRVEDTSKPLREDIPVPGLDSASVFKNAPKESQNHFAIPKTVK